MSGPAIVTKSFRSKSFRVLDPQGYPYAQNAFDDPEPIHEFWNFAEGDVALDVGASFGAYTLFALALGAEVIAFEPSLDGHRGLTENVALNGWQDRCTIHKAALYNGEDLPRELTDEVFGFHYRAEGVVFKKLDDYAIQRVDKMDIEGAELAALEGGVETLRRTRPSCLLIEDHDGINPNSAVSRYPASIQSSRKIHELLRGLGYGTRTVPWGDHRKFIVAHLGARGE